MTPSLSKFERKQEAAGEGKGGEFELTSVSASPFTAAGGAAAAAASLVASASFCLSCLTSCVDTQQDELTNEVKASDRVRRESQNRSK